MMDAKYTYNTSREEVGSMKRGVRWSTNRANNKHYKYDKINDQTYVKIREDDAIEYS